MINYNRSTFTWESHPWKPDPHYRWMGGFVGEPGQAYHVRFTLQASCTIQHPDAEQTVEIFLGSPCRSEYTIARRNLFQIPSGEWRMAFSKTHKVDIAQSLDDSLPSSATDLNTAFAGHTIDIRNQTNVTELLDAQSIVDATLTNDILNARSTYQDHETGCHVTLEYPVNVMNLNVTDGEWQVCTGPVIVPDLRSWDGSQITRVYLAHVAISAFDHVELIFRRPVEVTEEVAEWLDRPRGRDRLELRDADNPPPGYPPKRPRPAVYHDVWELEAENVVLAANTDP
mgnify:CR=1 FL=1